MRKTNFISFLLGFTMLFAFGNANAQCPTIYDSSGGPSSNPVWLACFGGNYTLNIQSDDAIGGWTIDWGDGNTSNGNGFPTSHVYTATVDEYTVTIHDNDNNCDVVGTLTMESSTSASILIPDGGVTQSCAPQAMEFVNASTDVSPNTTFTWNFGDGSGLVTFDHNNQGVTVSHMYEQGTVNCQTMVTLTAQNKCNQGVQSVATYNPIKIWDLDQANINPSSTSLCWPDNTFYFENGSDLNCNSPADGNTNQRYEFWNFGDYWGQGQDSIVNWTAFPPTLTYEIEYPALGDYEVMMIDSNYCGVDTAYITVSIVDPPTSGIAHFPNPACVGSEVTFLNTSTAEADTFMVSYDAGVLWEGANPGNLYHTFNTVGSIDVGLVSFIAGASATCADTSWTTVDVTPGPVADISLSQSILCGTGSIDITNNSSNSILWNWDYGNGQTSSDNSPLSPVYNSFGIYPISLELEAANGCTLTARDTLVVSDSPTPEFSFIATCEGDTILFTDNSTFDAAYPITYLWDFGDGTTSTDQNPAHAFGSGLYNVNLTISNGNCSNNIIHAVDVSDGSQSNFSVSISEGCSPLEVEFTNAQANPVNNWIFGDGSSSFDASPTHTYTNSSNTPQDYTLTYFTQNILGCNDSSQVTITVHPLPMANFLMQSGNACAPLDVAFANISLNADTYIWEFEPGINSTAITPDNYVFTNTTDAPITYYPTLISTSNFGCADTITKEVTVNPLPTYTFDLSDQSGCSPLTATMPPVDDAVSYLWDFGNGLTSLLAQPSQTYINNTDATIDYTVTLVAYNSFGCSDTTNTIISVHPTSAAQFSPNTITACSPDTVSFDDNSILATSYTWDFGDGTTSNDIGDISHGYTNNGNAPIQYTASLTVVSDQGCENTSNTIITVYPEIISSFDSETQGCSPLTINFDNTSTGSSFSYWEMGDGNVSISDSPINQYINSGTDDISFTASLVSTSTFGCADTSYKEITVHPEAISDFSTDVVQGCAPLEVTISNTTNADYSYAWDYGNGNTGDSSDPTHTTILDNNSADPIGYTISLESTNQFGCTKTSQKDIQIFPKVLASFDVDTTFCSDANITFTNNTTGASQYTWDFGDSMSANSINPIHSYTNISGITDLYNVQLTAQSTYGCTDDTTIVLNIYTSPIADFSIDSTSLCHPLYIELGNNSQFATEYAWTYGDGDISNIDSLTHSHIYTNPGSSLLSQTIELEATSEHGCIDNTSIDIQVIPDLIAEFEEVIPDCHPLPVHFTNTSEGALEYQWNFNDGGMSDIANPTNTFYNNGTEDQIYNVSLVAYSYFGCTDTITHEVLVYAQPIADFNTSPGVQTFPNATISIDDFSVYGSSDFTWSMGDGNVIDTTITSYTYGESGSYQITLTIDNGHCSDTNTEQIIIQDPAPFSAFEGAADGCVDLTVDFINLSEFGESYIWSFGDGASSTEFSPSHTYTIPGAYNVSLFVTGAGGTDIEIHTEAVNAYPNALAEFTVNPNIAQIGEEVLFFNLSQNAGIYEWDFGNGITSTSTNPSVVYDDFGTYDISLISNNEYNCPDTLYMPGALEVNLLDYLVFPNAFTPDVSHPADEYYNPESLNNDVFFPKFNGIETYLLQIYNRWGEIVFETDDKNKGWNGYYNGELAPLGVYVWKVKATFLNDEEVVKVGDLTLLR